MINQRALLEIAIIAAIEAGEKILGVYNSDDFGIESKADESPLTKADLLAHQCIMSHLEKTNIPVLSEEGASIQDIERSRWEKIWIVDPLDGTKEFIKRNGEFTVNIALIINQFPCIGVVYVPVTKTIYWGAEEFGSYSYVIEKNESPIKLESKFKLPKTSSKPAFTVVASRSHLSQDTENYIEDLRKIHGDVQIVSKGSSLKLCMVADGTADCYPRFAPTMEWDIAAGHAVCKFSGKSVIDFTTKKEMLYNRENLTNNWFVVS
jgi:3'(2'), 5'-bisphosphate nucleotidase